MGNLVSRHPCFDERAHYTTARIHLPVAPRCNIQCNYCSRSIGGAARPYRPGVSAEILSPEEALDRVDATLDIDDNAVVGIAGPGDPLANPETYQTLALIRDRYPDAVLCLCTNGLELVQWLPELRSVGLNAITVTINAIEAAVGARIHEWVTDNGEILRGEEAAGVLLKRQLEGLRQASEHGMAVKVNTVMIPGINDHHIPEVARAAKQAGAILMNIMPLIPLGRFSQLRAPRYTELSALRQKCERLIPQFRLCKQCPADIVGIPGKCDMTFQQWVSRKKTPQLKGGG